MHKPRAPALAEAIDRHFIEGTDCITGLLEARDKVRTAFHGPIPQEPGALPLGIRRTGASKLFAILFLIDKRIVQVGARRVHPLAALFFLIEWLPGLRLKHESPRDPGMAGPPGLPAATTLIGIFFAPRKLKRIK